jgi:hypothetical protein
LQSPPESIWTPVDSSGLYPKLVFGKDYLWYKSRVRVRVRVLRRCSKFSFFGKISTLL